jgi:hypothetical protein
MGGMIAGRYVWIPIPAQPHQRFHIRFSLRLVLLLFTLVAVLLTWLKAREDGRHLRIEGQKAIAQWERDIVLTELAPLQKYAQEINTKYAALRQKVKDNPLDRDLLMERATTAMERGRTNQQVKRLNIKLAELDAVLSAH